MSVAKTTSLEIIQTCSFCGNDFPLDRTACPHCSRPMLFPNVAIANMSTEKAKLAEKYSRVVDKANAEGCTAVIEKFSDACRNSSAVFRCELLRLHRQIASGSEIFAPYYALERLRLRASQNQQLNFEKLRPSAEIELLGNEKYVGQIHYACLSLDGQGLNTYGDCVVQLAPEMIAHRSSCFEGNTAVIFAIEHGFGRFVRSDWENRHQICVAMMGGQLNCTMTEADFSAILALPDPDGSAENDVFVEVHVFGEITARTFQSVEIQTSKHSKGDRTYLAAIKEKLGNVAVPVTIK